MATTAQSSRQNAWRRIWHTPTSKAALYWLIFAAIYTTIFYVLYAVLFKAPIFTGPWFDHVFRVGVMSYLMILATAAYSLRTRFVRGFPGKRKTGYGCTCGLVLPPCCSHCCTLTTVLSSTVTVRTSAALQGIIGVCLRSMASCSLS